MNGNECEGSAGVAELMTLFTTIRTRIMKYQGPNSVAELMTCFTIIRAGIMKEKNGVAELMTGFTIIWTRIHEVSFKSHSERKINA